MIPTVPQPPSLSAEELDALPLRAKLLRLVTLEMVCWELEQLKREGSWLSARAEGVGHQWRDDVLEALARDRSRAMGPGPATTARRADRTLQQALRTWLDAVG
jgi:hypothetical protein